eukprot:6384023-Amphidinium_carterae.2
MSHELPWFPVWFGNLGSLLLEKKLSSMTTTHEPQLSPRCSSRLFRTYWSKKIPLAQDQKGDSLKETTNSFLKKL